MDFGDSFASDERIFTRVRVESPRLLKAAARRDALDAELAPLEEAEGAVVARAGRGEGRVARRRAQELGEEPSRMSPIWYAGAYAIGAASGLLGDKWSLGFIAETADRYEREIYRTALH